MANKSPNPTDMHIGARIRMRRLMLGMSQTKLGDALNLTFQQVQKYEKGANRVGGSRLQQIAGVLQVEPAFFFEGGPIVPGQKRVNGDAPSPAFVGAVLSTSDGLSLVEAFSKIKSSKVRRHLVATAELFVVRGAP